MWNTVLLSAALLAGQTQVVPPGQARLLPPVNGRVVYAPGTTVSLPSGAQPIQAAPVNVPHYGTVVHSEPYVLSTGKYTTVSGTVVSPGSHCAPCVNGGCANGNGCAEECTVTWLKPWTPEDLEMKPVEPKKRSCCDCSGGFFSRLLFCPEEPEEEKKDCNGNGKNGNGNGDQKNPEPGKSGEEKKDGAGNGNGITKTAFGEPTPAKNGNGAAGNGAAANGAAGNGAAGTGSAGNGDQKNPEPGKSGEEKKNGNGNGNGAEKEEEEEPDLNPLMQHIKCRHPMLFDCMDQNGLKVYGWIQGGFTGNFDSPRDRLNYGVNFNNRSNDFLLNQAYIVLEKSIDYDKKVDEYQIGGRLDVFYGHDAPYWENLLGIFPNFTGDRLESPRLTENGLSIPQAYVDIHTPWLTKRGLDFRIGRFYTLMGFEVNPAPATDFYSHNYEFFYAMPFTHTGVLSILRIGDTVDLYNGIVRGWDVATSDTNDTQTYIGSFVYNSCDKRNTVAISWVHGPEQLGNNDNERSAISAYYTKKFGCYDQWRFVTGGHIAWEQNASGDLPNRTETSTATPAGARSAEWYGYNTYLFYTVDPKLTFGTRFEWWRDDDGSRTGFANSDNGGARFNRPGYAGNFYDLTFNFTYRPYQNLRIRPEIRFDYFDGFAIDRSGSRPYNDQRDNFQTTAAFDIIYEF